MGVLNQLHFQLTTPSFSYPELRLVTFLAVIIWTWILGPIGAFMALPLTVMVKKLLLKPFPQTQLVASLLGSGDEEATKEK